MGNPVLVAFDPGPHTGVAVFLNGELYESGTFAMVPPPVIPTRRSLFTLLAGLPDEMGQGRPQVVIEDFRTAMAPTRDGLTTIKLIGFLEGICVLLEYPVALQLPAVRRPFIGRAKTIAPHPSLKHEVDAIAQGLAYLERDKVVAHG